MTARRVSEDLQDVLIPVSVLTEDFIAETGAFKVGRLREIVPTIQFYSTNPRNTAINIRGLGASYGLTNDGLDAGVGNTLSAIAGCWAGRGITSPRWTLSSGLTFPPARPNRVF